MNKKQLEKYWQTYLSTLPDRTLSIEIYNASQFGDRSDLADKLGSLILKGVKTATCSALWEWEAEGSEREHLTLLGDNSIDIGSPVS